MRLPARLLGPAAALLAAAAPASAHDGPPYPIVVDERLEAHVVSIWADPDVGVGTFYVYLEPEPAEADLPRLSIAVRPGDDHAPEAAFEAVPARKGAPFQLFGEVDFDRRGPWDVRFTFEGPEGSEEIRLPVDVTPPGMGTIDLLWYLFPFLLVGFLWIKIFLKRREIARASVPC